MSTWHQQKAGIPPLWHPTLWTVVIDPPNECLCVDRYKDPVDAQRCSEGYNRKNPGSSYVIAPHQKDRG